MIYPTEALNYYAADLFSENCNKIKNKLDLGAVHQCNSFIKIPNGSLANPRDMIYLPQCTDPSCTVTVPFPQGGQGPSLGTLL